MNNEQDVQNSLYITRLESRIADLEAAFLKQQEVIQYQASQINLLLKENQELKEIIAAKDRQIAEKDKQISELTQKVTDLTEEVTHLREQVALLRDEKFGSSSEKLIELNDDANGEEISEEEANQLLNISGYTRKAGKKGRKGLPSNLPRQQVIHDLCEEEKNCPHCQTLMKCIGKEISEQLAVIPELMYVLQHVKYKYACQCCEQGIKVAPMPPQPIPKSIASPELLSYIVVSKCEDHLPLYRQEKRFLRSGVELSRQTLSSWVIRCGELVLPLCNLMLDEINTYDIAYCDETKVQVLKEPGRAPQTKSMMWVLGGGAPERFCYLFHYSPSRAHTIARGLLEDFKGYLHCDGYGGYDALSNQIEKIILVACWYHVRRRFVKVARVNRKQGLAYQALRMIRQLSDIEKKAKAQNLSPEQIKELRLREAVPILNQFHAWLEANKDLVPPKSLLGDAIHYALNQWQKLLIYTTDGRLEISNNLLERNIKGFALSRKNFLFADTVEGVLALARLFSLIQTCKHHNINSYAYFTYILRQLPLCKTVEDFEKLLPYNIDKALLDQYLPDAHKTFAELMKLQI